MPKKIQDCTKAHLISIDLPVHGDSYTVISHESVMDYVFTELATAGFVVTTEEYRATADGQIAQGIYKLNYNSDPELNMMFAWTNSYNKQVRFKCGVGAYVNQTGTVMVCGDMGSWARKHTGTADAETIQTIKDQITNATMYYNQLVADKEAMKGISMTKRKQAQMLGILFAEYQILTTEQASMIRSQMDRPGHVFADSNSLWAFYNYVTTALQHSHPKTWMEDQRVLHYFISTINNFATPQVIPQVTPQVEAVVDSLTANYGQPENQLNILTEIDKIEAEEPSLELEQNEEYLENPVNLETLDEISSEAIEETVSYTDPMGNTFEAPIVIESIEPEEEEEEFQIAEDQEWTGENASNMSLGLSPADYEMMEAIESSVGIPIEADLDNVPTEKKEEIIDNSFDLDFQLDNVEETDDNTPDFF
jgi:hypothetical protein